MRNKFLRVLHLTTCAHSQASGGWCLATRLTSDQPLYTRQFSASTVISCTCLSATGARLGSRLLSWCLKVVIGGKVLKEVALLLHDAVELVSIDRTITITVSLVDHILQLLVINGLAKLLSHTSKVLEGDLGGAIIVEHLEHLLDILTRILLAHLASHHAQELSKLDGAVAVVVNVRDHLLELLVFDLEAEGTHGSLELTHID